MDTAGGEAPGAPAAAPEGGSGHDRGRLAAAYERLRSHWFWWVLLGHAALDIEVGGRVVGIAPVAYLVAPLLVGALRATAAALPASARPPAERSARLAVVAAVAIIGGRLLAGRQNGLVDVGMALDAAALCAFARAMRAYADGRARDAVTGDERAAAEHAARRWRTAAVPTALAAGGLGALATVRIGRWAFAGEPLDAMLDGSAPWSVVEAAGVVVVVSCVAALVTVIRASGPTRDLLHGA